MRQAARTPLLQRIAPQDAFLRLAADGGDVFWLDSGPAGTHYLGTGTPVKFVVGGVLPGLRAALAEPGTVALVGWLGYELLGETLGLPVAADTVPASWLRVTSAVAIDARSGEVEALGAPPAWLEDTPLVPGDSGRVRIAALDDEASYVATVRACQEAIRAGEAYQMCLTSRFDAVGMVDPIDAYLRLRAASPAHHGGFIRIGDTSLLSASPERFLEVAGRRVATHPIKGTRPRSADRDEDARLAAELLASDKERAENLMIVDLMRNDLQRVCEVGSVEVSRLFAVESYPQVHQLVSTVEGRLRAGMDALDAIAACFPAGSMTGAPKRRAVELLAALEQRPRGVYSGAFGWLAPDGDAELAMVIRSIVATPGAASVGAGGGITALSVPEEEYAEMRLKAEALLGVLKGGVLRGGASGSAEAEAHGERPDPAPG